MATSARHLIFFLLITVLSSSLLHITHARDSQFFSKTPTTTNTNVVVPNAIEESKEPTEATKNQGQAEPTFLPQNEESYGLYGHETGQLPPSSTATADESESKQPLRKYLPKNYNTVAYVTVPENTDEDDTSEFRDESSLGTNPHASSYDNSGEENYYNGQAALTKEEDFSDEYRSYPTSTRNSQLNKNSYYKLGSDFNSPRETTTPTTTTTFRNSAAEGFQRQGMSDTRFLENGRYGYYASSDQKLSGNYHPYETLEEGANYNGNNRMNDNEFKGENYYEPAGEYNSQDHPYDTSSDNSMP